MSIQVEFYGIPRRRAGVAETTLEVGDESVRLGDVLKRLAIRFPALTIDCLDGEHLCSTVAANRAGREFLSDPDATLRSGDALLLLSADGGG